MKKAFKWSMVLVLLVIVVSAFMIFYTVFGGGNKASIPPLSGVTVTEAVSQLERMGVKTRVEQVESTLPQGTVLTQWPETGTRIRDNQIVILKVSRGGHRFSLPDVRGLEKEQAIEKLSQSGFEIGDVLMISDKKSSAGVVIAQSPSAPAMIPANKPIDLMVSKGAGQENGKVIVPDLLQRQEEVARRMLSESDLKLSGIEYEYTINTPRGMVMGMTPEPGDSVSPGSPVKLIVATMKKPEEEKTEPEEENVSVTMPGMASKTAKEGQKKVQEEEEQNIMETGETEVAVPGISTAGSAPPSQSESEETPVIEQEKKSIARIRYQVPPLSEALSLTIEMIDSTSTRTILDKDVNGGEYISLDEEYSGNAVVTIYLGGEFVWQDKYQ